MQRQRRGGGDRYGGPTTTTTNPNYYSPRPSLTPDVHPNRNGSNTVYNSNIDSRSPTYQVGTGGFQPMDRLGGGFRPIGGGDRRLEETNYQRPPLPHLPQPLSGQKRGFPAPGNRLDSGNFVKIFVGSVPRTATEQDIRPIFEAHGNVLEVALIKDKRTGQQQGCCFIKYATSEEADRAISALHNKHSLRGGMGPIQVRYADGERERLGAVEYKLFVGCLDKHANEKDVEEIFAPYGQVEDVYLMRDDMRQSRGCGFVKYAHRDMALAAINSLNGIYTMRGCDQPLIVRFADPKRQKSGDSRIPTYGGPGSLSQFQTPVASTDRAQPNAWPPMRTPNVVLSPNDSSQVFRDHLPSRSGDLLRPLNQKPLQSPQKFPPITLQLPSQVAPHLQVQTMHGSQPNASLTVQIPFYQGLPLKNLMGVEGQSTGSIPQRQQHTTPTIALQESSDVNVQLHSGPMNRQQFPSHFQQPLQQSTSQLAQMLSQQTQTLQARFQSSQQAFSQLQQQLHMLQQPTQSVALQQNAQATKQQWPGVTTQTIASNHTSALSVDVPSSTSTSVAPTVSQKAAPALCNWTEHTSPDGFKYYHNRITGESRWEKPEELKLFDLQQLQQTPSGQHPQQIPSGQHPQQKPSSQPVQTQRTPQVLPMKQVPQAQQVPPQAQLQMQFHDLRQLQPSFPSSGHKAAEEWMWKNKPSGK